MEHLKDSVKDRLASAGEEPPEALIGLATMLGLSQADRGN
jgi:hypothetical protein